MSPNQKKLYRIFFIITLIYTMYGILQMSKDGGPCNAGIALIFLTPLLLVCSVLIVMAVPAFQNDSRRNWTVKVIACIFSLILWNGAMYIFSDGGDVGEVILYLSLFDILNIWRLVTLFKQKALIRIDD